MRIDTQFPSMNLERVPSFTQEVERLGFDGVWTSETTRDPFLPCALLAVHSKRVQFGTAIAVSFARSPADIAYTAWDLSAASGGRFILGLGTQVKAHITRRFGMTWPDSPVAKLREQLGAIRAFWRAWQDGKKLDFQGKYYQLNLMTPFFNPGPIDHPDIPIFIAGVNTGLAKLAGETADGFHVHPFHTPAYLRNVLLPAIENGAEKEGRSLEDVEISVTVFTAQSPEEERFAREQIAFYASTPSYRRVMAYHGWEGAAEQLSQLASRGAWKKMSGEITDEMLDAFVTTDAFQSLGRALVKRYQGIADRITLYRPFQPGVEEGFWNQVIAEVQESR
jgi:probable F420-dependent oxidoreductase